MNATPILGPYLQMSKYLSKGLLWLGTFAIASAAHAQQGASAPDLARQATDPTASLMTFNVIGRYVGDYRGDDPGADDQSSEIDLRPVIPFTAFGLSNILRLTLPYNTGGRGAHGLGTVSIFDLIVHQRTRGRVGYGAVASLSPEGAAADEFAIGPAIGGVWQISDNLDLGVFNQNLLANDTSISQIQPIFARQLRGGWSVSAGDLQWVYDWKDGGWVSLPVGFEVGKVTRIGRQPVRWAVNPQYDLVDDPGTARWSVRFTFAVLVPGN
jgi:hypothetical protein